MKITLPLVLLCFSFLSQAQTVACYSEHYKFSITPDTSNYAIGGRWNDGADVEGSYTVAGRTLTARLTVDGVEEKFTFKGKLTKIQQKSFREYGGAIAIKATDSGKSSSEAAFCRATP